MLERCLNCRDEITTGNPRFCDEICESEYHEKMRNFEEAIINGNDIIYKQFQIES